MNREREELPETVFSTSARKATVGKDADGKPGRHDEAGGDTGHTDPSAPTVLSRGSREARDEGATPPAQGAATVFSTSARKAQAERTTGKTAPSAATVFSTSARKALEQRPPPLPSRTDASIASPSRATDVTAQAPGHVELDVGTTVKHRFELCEEIGHGGMGVVFKARDLRKVEALDPDPYVAIKFLTGTLAAIEQGFISLQREAKNAQELNHPNIVKVYDFDRDGAHVFLTMELLEGESLQARVRAAKVRPLKDEERARIVRGMFAGVAYAHERGIAHADLKPSNVFVDGKGDAKILDFGIARRAERDRAFDADDIGALTFDYASPEMLEDQRPIPGDDVFALACIIYRLHAGRHPFGHERADHARNKGVRPARPPGLTRVQWRALQRGLAFTRAERFADAAAFDRAWHGRDWQRIGGVAAGVLAAALALGWYFSDTIASGMAGWGAVQSVVAEWRMSDADRAQLAEANQAAQDYRKDGNWEAAFRASARALKINPFDGAGLDNLRQSLDLAAREGGDSGEYRAFLEMEAADANQVPIVREEIARRLQAAAAAPVRGG